MNSKDAGIVGKTLATAALILSISLGVAAILWAAMPPLK
jgi:hypothetical protein